MSLRNLIFMGLLSLSVTACSAFYTKGNDTLDGAFDRVLGVASCDVARGARALAVAEVLMPYLDTPNRVKLNEAYTDLNNLYLQEVVVPSEVFTLRVKVIGMSAEAVLQLAKDRGVVFKETTSLSSKLYKAFDIASTLGIDNSVIREKVALANGRC